MSAPLSPGDKLLLAVAHLREIGELTERTADELDELGDALDSKPLSDAARALSEAHGIAATLADELDGIGAALGSRKLSRIVVKLARLVAGLSAQHATLAAMAGEEHA